MGYQEVVLYSFASIVGLIAAYLSAFVLYEVFPVHKVPEIYGLVITLLALTVCIRLTQTIIRTKV